MPKDEIYDSNRDTVHVHGATVLSYDHGLIAINEAIDRVNCALNENPEAHPTRQKCLTKKRDEMVNYLNSDFHHDNKLILGPTLHHYAYLMQCDLNLFLKDPSKKLIWYFPTFPIDKPQYMAWFAVALTALTVVWYVYFPPV